MAIWTMENAAARTLSALYADTGGAARPLSGMYTDIGGVSKQVFSSAPAAVGDPLSTVPIGDSVLLEENGEPQEYQVWDHAYTAPGITLLVRRWLYGSKTAFSSSKDNTYANSLVDRMLCTEFRKRFPQNVQNALMTVPIPVLFGTDVLTCGTEMRSIFLLSSGEAGNYTDRDYQQAGNDLDGRPTAYAAQSIQQNISLRAAAPGPGQKTDLWYLRTPFTFQALNRRFIYCVKGDGSVAGYLPQQSSSYVRPALAVSGSFPVIKAV